MDNNFDRKEAAKNFFRINRYALDDRFVLKDGKKHPFAVICPGGGYSCVCSFVEGSPVAEEFNKRGYSAFIVFYRVRKKAEYPNPQDDLAKAIKTIQENKEKYNLTGDDYILAGFSAGGHLASSFATKEMGYAKYNLLKPSALILGYPVTSMEKDISHKDTHNNHLGKNPDTELEKKCTVYYHVDSDYPKTFIATGTSDKTVDVRNTSLMEEALNKEGVENKVLYFEGMDHGFGKGAGTIAENWIDKAIDFAEGK